MVVVILLPAFDLHWLKVLHTSNARGEKPVGQCIEMGEVCFQDRGEFPSTDLRAARLAVVAFWVVAEAVGAEVVPNVAVPSFSSVFMIVS